MHKHVHIEIDDGYEVTVDIEYDHHHPEIVRPEPCSSIEGRVPGSVDVRSMTVIGVARDGEYTVLEALTDDEARKAISDVEEYLDGDCCRIYEVLGLV